MKLFRSISSDTLLIALAAVLVIVVLVNVILAFGVNSSIRKGIEEAQSRLRPAAVEITVLKNSKCSDCFSSSEIINYIKTAKVNVTKESEAEFDTGEGKALISKYGIRKIPAVIVTGDIKKISLDGLEKKDDALVFDSSPALYTDAGSGEVVGRVTLYHLKQRGCAECNGLGFMIDQLKNAGVRISEEKEVFADSEEGKALISKYDIGFAPALVLSRDAEVYEIIQQAWPQVGSMEEDGNYVMRLIAPPFVNLTTGKLRGITSLTYLNDKSCAECYDVKLHRQILTNEQSFAFSIGKEEEIDISSAEGKKMLAKYNITKVPTAMLQGDVSAYPSSGALGQFFSVEKDGSYVFRKLDIVGAYKDLSTNEIVKPTEQQQ